jgi:hypothetical protein
MPADRETPLEGRPGPAGTCPSAGGLGGPFEAPPVRATSLEGRPGSAGPPPSAGGLGGPFEAPRVTWSTAVMIEERDGRLVVPLPPQLAAQLAVGAGDVLCYTAFANGTVEVWSVRKNPYETLDVRPR